MSIEGGICMNIQTIVPEECVRTKKIRVDDNLENAFRKSFSSKRAEKLPEESYYKLYIGEQHIESIYNNNNSIIWGRRGTGKTHLLKAFCQKINEATNTKEIAFYVSCDDITLETPVQLFFKNDEERIKYHTREAFKTFFTNLFDEIIDNYEKILTKKTIFIKSKAEKQKMKQNIENELTNLLELCKYGYSTTVALSEKSEEQLLTENNTSSGVDLKFAPQKTLLESLGIEIKRKKDKNVKREIKISRENQIINRYDFRQIKKSFDRLTEYMEVDRMYICIDELWMIDDKKKYTIQPYFLELLRKSIFSQKKIAIKIASIRETTKLNTKISFGQNIGLQSKQDIFEDLNLDVIYLGQKYIEEMFIKILTKRINYYSSIQYTEEYILSTVFKEKRYFNLLVVMSHGIPRNFLRIVEECMSAIQYNLSEYFLHIYLIVNVVMNIYANDKRSSLSFEENSVYGMISQYLQQSKNAFFLIENEPYQRIYTEVNNLIYTEIVHRLPSSLTPEGIRDKYKAFFVDSGKYLSTINDFYQNELNDIVSNYRLIIPSDLQSDFQKYILNLDNVSSNFIECPNCGNRVNKEHPIYRETQRCYNCAYQFSDSTF